MSAAEISAASNLQPNTLSSLLRTLVTKGELEKRPLPGGRAGYALATPTEAPAAMSEAPAAATAPPADEPPQADAVVPQADAEAPQANAVVPQADDEAPAVTADTGAEPADAATETTEPPTTTKADGSASGCSAAPPAAAQARISSSCSRVTLPPVATMATRRPCNRSPSASAAASGDAPAGLDQVARRLDHRALRRADLVVADEDEVVEVVMEDRLGQLERRAGREALGVGPVRRLHAAGLLPRPVRGGRRLGLHGDHLGRRVDGLGHDAGAGGAAPPTDGDDDDLHLGEVLEDLERLGAHARDQMRLVARVHVAETSR